MSVTIDEVAKLAGCSKGTVSRVLNKKGYISEETRRKVEQAVRDLNYYPSEVARSVASQKTFMIGLIVPTTNHPFFAELTYFIERSLSEFGYKLMICNTLNDIKKEEEYVTKLMSNQVDGMIVASQNSINVDYNFPGLPIIAIDHFISDEIPVIRSDNYQGGYLATTELVDVGCRNILCVNPIKNQYGHVNQRSQAYQDVVAQNDLKTYYIELQSALSRTEKGEVIEKNLKDMPEIDGVFAQDDETAILFLTILHKMGRTSAKVIGYDGASVSRLIRPDLSTIQQPIEKLAYESVVILLGLMRKEIKFKKEYVLPVKLIKSETTMN